jgi:GNAT superfamily N-acetyltransferase
MSSKEAIFRRYAADRRRCEYPGMTRTDLTCAVLYESHSALGEHFLQFTSLDAQRADAFIAQVVAQAEKSARGLEWKTYGFDTPADLVARLQRAGFEPDDEESFMVYPLSKFVPRPFLENTNWRIEQITDVRGIEHIVSLQERIWARDFPWLYDKLCADLASGIQHFFCAYRGEVPIGCGYIEYLAGSQFPELHGGSVLPEYRGRGIYSALYAARFADAIARGYEYVAVDASAMSRPILEAIGFEWICVTRPMRFAADPIA